jgi:hypothetical protein
MRKGFRLFLILGFTLVPPSAYGCGKFVGKTLKGQLPPLPPIRNGNVRSLIS